MKKEENNNKITTNNLIALINIIDYYEEFSKNMKRFISKKDNNRDLIERLESISRNEICIKDMGARNFYKANKDAIDIINNYSSIHDFICLNYDYRGIPFDNYDKLDYYYDYLLKNKNKIEQIKLTLRKIKELDLTIINLNEEYNFTESNYYFSFNPYSINKEEFYYERFYYLDNIQILPNYEKNVIEYCTKKSDYKIVIKSFDNIYNSNEIYVNSLFFNPNSLPINISREETLDKILNMKKENNIEDRKIREAIELSVTTDDLEDQSIKTSSIINKMNNEIYKKELNILLNNILDSISKMREIEHLFYQDIINNSKKINEKRLSKEKRLYLEKRSMNELDSD
ncbi:MAG: hypothetical protein IKF19_05820 [Bacilli bacterium]|nr:hypothetical protein [Bacilli bacterium]